LKERNVNLEEYFQSPKSLLEFCKKKNKHDNGAVFAHMRFLHLGVPTYHQDHHIIYKVLRRKK
jgi:hypothetical protein